MKEESVVFFSCLFDSLNTHTACEIEVEPTQKRGGFEDRLLGYIHLSHIGSASFCSHCLIPCLCEMPSFDAVKLGGGELVEPSEQLHTQTLKISRCG